MYLSHPVRRIREDPIEGETVSLVLDIDEEATTLDGVAEAVTDCGGRVEDRLAFGSLEVTIAQERVADVCEIDGIDAIETTNTIASHGDAGEDVG
jgi:hypothetical protein